MNQDEYHKAIVEVSIIRGDAARAEAEVWDRLANKVATPYVQEQSAKSNKEDNPQLEADVLNLLNWKRIDKGGNQKPFEVTDFKENSDTKDHEELYKKAFDYIEQRKTTNTYGEKSWSCYYWLKTEEGKTAIFRRPKTRS